MMGLYVVIKMAWCDILRVVFLMLGFINVFYGYTCDEIAGVIKQFKFVAVAWKHSTNAENGNGWIDCLYGKNWASYPFNGGNAIYLKPTDMNLWKDNSHYTAPGTYFICASSNPLECPFD